jgi:uncharacterized protein (DUF58 family)
MLAVALSKVAMLKEDKAGLITISEHIGSVVPADRKASQLGSIMNVLYKEKTRYLESNLEALYSAVRSVVKQRGPFGFLYQFRKLIGTAKTVTLPKKNCQISFIGGRIFRKHRVKRIEHSIQQKM